MTLPAIISPKKFTKDGNKLKGFFEPSQFNRINLEDELFNKISSSMINKEEYIESYTRLNDVIREVSVSRNVDLIDLANLIPSSSNYIYDSVHLNENGSKLAAEILTDYWLKKLELQ